jgi:hypothetical protein
VKMYNTNTQARKMKFKQELHNLEKQDEHQWLFYKGEKPCRCSCIYRSPCRWWRFSGRHLKWIWKKL